MIACSWLISIAFMQRRWLLGHLLGRLLLVLDFQHGHDWPTFDRFMIRLNSGILMIFEPIERNLNLNASDCRASKIIPNDTKLEPISWELNLKNPLFNFCLGVWVRGHDATNVSHIPKSAQKNSTSFNTNVTTRDYRGKMVLYEKPTKNGNKVGWNCVGVGEIK